MAYDETLSKVDSWLENKIWQKGVKLPFQLELLLKKMT